MITSRSFFYFSIIQIVFILLVSFSSTVDSYERSSSYRKNDFTNGLKQLKGDVLEFNSIPGIKQYEAISGINAGYGFFAPNVASAYVLKVSVYDKRDKNNLKIFYYPPFKTSEGLNRYHTLLGYFQERLTILENKLNKKKAEEFKESDKYGEYLDIFIKSIGRYYYKEYSPEQYSVECTLYLYHYPLLQQSMLQKKEPVLIQLLNVNVNPRKK